MGPRLLHEKNAVARLGEFVGPKRCPDGAGLLGLTRDQRRRVASRFYDRRVAVGEVRPGYELWRPNREKAESITTKFVLALLLAATSAIAFIVTITGFSLMTGGSGMGVICLIYAALYAFFTFLVIRWNRGILPVAAALSMILAILCAVGANSWFARDKAGFEEALVSVTLIGLLVVILAILQLLVVAVSLYAFNQNWNVEEERPIGSGEDYGAGATPDDAPPLPA
jgi:amino acid transporter